MKKVGTITESRMLRPAEPKLYPLVSDSLFGGKVKIEENAKKGYPKKGVKGGTKAAAKIAKAKKVGKAKLLKDADKVLSLGQTETPSQKGGRSMSSYASQRGNTENPGNEKVGGPYSPTTDEAKKDDNWIQGAEEDIERRGTEGKCTPITKKGCTGRAKALAKTFKKMAKKKKAKNEAAENPDVLKKRLEKEREEFRKKAPLKKPGLQPGQLSIGDPKHPDHKPAKDPLTDAFEPLAKPRGTAKAVRRDTASAEARPNKPLNPTQAKNVAGNPKAEMGARMKAADSM